MANLPSRFSNYIINKKSLDIEYSTETKETMPVQITVNIEDISMLKEIKQAIKMIKGVISVDKSDAMKSYERSRADVKAGRVVKCKDKEDFFNKLGF